MNRVLTGYFAEVKEVSCYSFSPRGPHSTTGMTHLTPVKLPVPLVPSPPVGSIVNPHLSYRKQQRNQRAIGGSIDNGSIPTGSM